MTFGLPQARSSLDSRYKSSLIRADSYLVSCMRYIDLDPVRASMVDEPAHYLWPSYRGNALGQCNARLMPHPVYLALGAIEKDGQHAYRALFRASLDQAAIDEIRLALNQNQPLGISQFTARIEQMTGERREARPRGHPRKAAGGPQARIDTQSALELRETRPCPFNSRRRARPALEARDRVAHLHCREHASAVFGVPRAVRFETTVRAWPSVTTIR